MTEKLKYILVDENDCSKIVDENGDITFQLLCEVSQSKEEVVQSAKNYLAASELDGDFNPKLKLFKLVEVPVTVTPAVRRPMSIKF